MHLKISAYILFAGCKVLKYSSLRLLCELNKQYKENSLLRNFLCSKAIASEVFPCSFCGCFMENKDISKACNTMESVYLGNLLNIILLLLLSSNIAYCYLMLERIDGNRKLHFPGNNKFA